MWRSEFERAFLLFSWALAARRINACPEEPRAPWFKGGRVVMRGGPTLGLVPGKGFQQPVGEMWVIKMPGVCKSGDQGFLVDPPLHEIFVLPENRQLKSETRAR